MEHSTQLILNILMMFSLCIPIYLANTDLCSAAIGLRCECPYMTMINCTGKSFTNIPAWGIRDNAITIDLSRNAITKIDNDSFSGLKYLQYLHLQENSIENIAYGSFKTLYQLKVLNLRQNSLTEIKSEMLYYLPNLVTLDFSSNSITTIQRDLLMQLPKLTQLVYNDNPLHCECEMRAFRQLLDARVGNLSIESGYCAGTDVKLTDMEDAQFGSCSVNMLESFTCLNCQNARTTDGCLNQNRFTNCSVSQYARPVCYEEIEEVSYKDTGIGDYYQYYFRVNKGCKDYKQCLEREKNNNENLKTLCCVGALCNGNALKGGIYVTTYLATAYLDATFSATNNLAWNFDTIVNTQITGVLNNVLRYEDYFVEVVGARGPELTVDVQINRMTLQDKLPNVNDITFFIKTTILSHYMLYTFIIKAVDVTFIDQSCPLETTYSDRGRFDWEPVNIGSNRTAVCPTHSSFMATRKCNLNIANNASYAQWGLPDYSSCPSTSKRNTTLEELSKTDITSTNAATVQTDLLALTKDAPTFNDTEVSLSMNVIENVLNENSIFSNERMIDEMVESLSNLLNSPDDAFSQNINKSSERFVNYVERLGNNIISSDRTFSSVHENLAMVVRQEFPSSFEGITVNAKVQPDEKLTDDKIIIENGENISIVDSGVVVPATILNKAQNIPHKLSFAIYSNNKIFKGIDATDLQSNADQQIDVNGPVISITLQNTNNLKQPVLFRFKHFNENSDKPRCVFIKTNGSLEFVWSTEGCYVRSSISRSHTDCECYHFTSFALLMDIYQTGERLSKINRLALTYISFIGCGVSLLGLVLTLITYLMFRKLRTKKTSKILIQLCLTLILTNTTFLIGMQEYTLDHAIGCKIVAASLHYVTLAALCWMLVEAFYMYLALVKVFNIHFSHFLLKCCLFGWGVPLLVVVVTLVVNSTNNYGKQKGGICWLSPKAFYAAFLAPVGTILILNFTTFIRVFLIIAKGSRITKAINDDSKTSVTKRLKGAIVLVTLLGLTWALAIFAIGDGGIVIQYLFTIFNSLQGLFIFIFNCLLNTDAQNAWRSYCQTHQKYDDSSINIKKTSSKKCTFDEIYEKKDFTDISKDNDTTYANLRSQFADNTKRFPSYSGTEM